MCHPAASPGMSLAPLGGPARIPKLFLNFVYIAGKLGRRGVCVRGGRNISVSAFSCFFAGISVKDSTVVCPLGIPGLQIPSWGL